MISGSDVEPPRGHELEHRFEVALLGPAHEAERIVVAALLVLRVVAPGAIGARHLEAQLLLVEVRTIELQAGDADQDDAAAPAAHAGRLRHRLVARGRGDDQHAIRAAGRA